jgi:hypothetical protein
VLFALFAPGGATGIAAPVPAERTKATKELAALTAKCEGSWKGTVGCQGNLLLRANSTYEWEGRGPGGDTETGVWELRGNPQSLTLRLKCKTADDLDREGKIVDVEITRVDETRLRFWSPESTEPLSFLRAMKPPRKP